MKSQAGRGGSSSPSYILISYILSCKFVLLVQHKRSSEPIGSEECERVHIRKSQTQIPDTTAQYSYT